MGDLPTLYRQLAELPTPVGAWFVAPPPPPPPQGDNHTTASSPTTPLRAVTVTFSRANVEQDASALTSLHTYTPIASATAASATAAAYAPFAPPVPLTSGAAYVPSPSGSKVFILREHASKPGAAASSSPPPASSAPSYVAEVLDVHGRVIASVLTSAIHGRVHKGATIGSIAWSNDEQAVAYIADPLSTPGSSFFDAPKPATAAGAAAPPAAAPSTAASLRGRQYEWREEWGEVLGGTSQPRVFVLSWRSLATATLSLVPGVPAHVSLTHAVWTPTNDGLVVVAIAHGQRRLGLAFYNSRPSVLCYLPVRATSTSAFPEPSGVAAGAAADPSSSSNALIALTPGDHSAAAPRFSPDGTWLLYSTTDHVWMHASCCRVRKLRWNDGVHPLVLARANANAQDGGSTSNAATATTTSFTDAPVCTNDATFDAALAPHMHTVVDVVDRPASVDAFPGFWQMLQLFKHDCWLADNRHVVLSSQWRAHDVLFVLDTTTGALFTVAPPFDGSVRVIGAHGQHVLVAASSPTRPPAVFVLELEPLASAAGVANASTGAAAWHALLTVDRRTRGADTSAVAASTSVPFQYRWTRVTPSFACTSPSVQAQVEQLQWTVLPFNAPPSSNGGGGSADTYTDLPYEAILLTPGPLPASNVGESSAAPASSASSSSSSSSSPLPRLVAFPHGGPHSAFTTWFSYASVFTALARFAVLHINYRGSTGYGMANLSSLPGKCGDQDVRDCVHAVHSTVRIQPPIVRPDNVAVMGGSHGGFLTCHLIGQHPELFSSAVVRNPVVNVAAMAALTDIPDWCFFETGLPYSPTRMPTAADYAHMFAASPIAHLSNVRTPLLLLLGTADRRVPPQQAIDYFRLLRARGVPARCLVYPDAQHSLTDRLGQEADVWVNTLAWMRADDAGDEASGNARGDADVISVALE